MRTVSILALFLGAVCLAPTPAAAQRFVSAGQPVSGRLSTTDPTLDDGSHYQIWSYRGRAGERLTIVLRSDDFDAYLAFGKEAGDACADCETNDDGGGGTDSRIRVDLPESGVYQIRVNSLSSGETGAFNLSVTSGVATAPAVKGEIRLGQSVEGTLEEGDDEADDGSYAEHWTYRGPEGQRVVITLRSDDFDAFLGWGRMVGGDWQQLESDDDGLGDGTHSCLAVTLGDDGAYTIRANTLSPGETGSYTLAVAAEGECAGGGMDEHDHGDEEWEAEEDGPVDLTRAIAVRAGGSYRGSLEESDPALGDRSHYDVYTYAGRAGERLTILMSSSAFDTFLAIGQVEEGMFVELESNDDGEEGTDSVLEITLPTAGTYVIRANSLSGGQTGAYTLEVRSSR